MAIEQGAVEGLEMNLFNDFFRGRKVWVTGHTGFKGTWLALWLKELGAEVTGYSLAPPTQPSLFNQLGLSKKIHSITADLRDLTRLSNTLKETEPEIVFHLAAQSLVRISYLDSLDTVSTNILGSANLLEAIRRTASVRICQVVTSDKCYENDESKQARNENDRLGGRDIYSASKACAEILVSAYRNSFFSAENPEQTSVSVSSVRAGNVIGGGDWSTDRILPDCIRALQKTSPVFLRNPSSVRPWQYVLDALSGYLLLAQRQGENPGEFASAWNFGPPSSEAWTVAKLTDAVIAEWGTGSWVTQDAAGEKIEPYESKFLQLDASKANSLLGWKTVYSTKQAVNQTVRWYQETQKMAAGKAYEFSVNQIRAYAAEAKKQKLSWVTQEKVLL